LSANLSYLHDTFSNHNPFSNFYHENFIRGQLLALADKSVRGPRVFHTVETLKQF
jgi:hypothetical protein